MLKLNGDVLLKVTVLVTMTGMLVVGCGTPKKIDIIRNDKLAATLALSRMTLSATTSLRLRSPSRGTRLKRSAR